MKRSYIYEVRNKTKQSNNFKRYLNDLCDNILRSIVIDTSEVRIIYYPYSKSKLCIK